MSETRGPSRWWYAVAAAVFVLGLVPIVVLGTNAVGGLLDYEVHDFDNAASTELEVEGNAVAIYSTYDGVGEVRCTAGGDAAAAGELEHPTWDFTYTRNSQEWHRVAVTPDGWDDGTYQVACNVVPPGQGSPQPQYGYAEDPSFLGTVLGLVLALGIAGLAALAALVLVVVVAVKRSKAKRPPLPPGPQFPQAPPPY